MKRIYILPLFFFAISCTGGLDLALDLAGDNRQELEKVLTYYKVSGETEKLAAAKFLVSNMPGHKNMRGEWQTYYDEVGNLLDTTSLKRKELQNSIEEVSASYDGRIVYRSDLKTITSDFLIKNIDTAYNQWKYGGWASHIDFDEFCEWLLPYTCSDTQPLYCWRDTLRTFAAGHIDRLNQCVEYINNPREAICIVNENLRLMIMKHKGAYAPSAHPIFDPETFAKTPGATCRRYAEMATLILRSKGIPVAHDFTIQWTDRQFGHDWCIYPTLRGKKTIFNPYSSHPDYPHNSYAKFAKVFRRTYSPNKEYVKLMQRHGGMIPEITDSPFFTDVSDEYQETVDLKIELLKGVKTPKRDVYIAVFDNFNWVPVYWGRRKGNHAVFKGMGKNVTYIAMSYIDNALVPASHPFEVDINGKVRYFRADYEHREDVVLTRKFPMFQHVFSINEFIRGGYVEASDSPDFHTAEIVCTFPDWELTSGSVKVVQSKPYRYWRFCAGEGIVSDMAELFLYSASGTRLKCKNIMLNDSEHSNMTDENPLTNYSAKGNELAGYLDLGEPSSVGHISFIRRGDGNAIMPNDEYAIYVWENSSWQCYAQLIAKDVFLKITNLPEGALCYIKGLSRGTQNRIFSVDNGKIIWH